MTDILISQDAQYALDLVQKICTQVGPGMPGSSQERERAAIIEKELVSHLGAGDVVVEEFSFAPGAYLSLLPGLFMLTAALLNICMSRFTGILPWLSAIAALTLSILSPALFAMEFLLGYELVDALFKKKTSQNVIGRLISPGTQSVKRLLIVSGHHDSAPENAVLVLLNSISRLLTRGSRLDGAREDTRLRFVAYAFYFLSGIFFAGFAVMLAASAIQLTGVITSNAGILRSGMLGWGLLAFPMAPAILYGLFAIKGKEGGGRVPGAVDNLSGSALTVALSRFLANNPSCIPAGTEIRFISFGSEEAGMRGSRRYVERHLEELKRLDARLLNFEMVAHPEVNILTSDMNGSVKNSPEMVESVAAAAERAGVPFKLQAASLGTASDATSFSKSGLKATTLLPFKSPQQMAAFYHQRWDRPEVLTLQPFIHVLRLTLEWVGNSEEQVKPTIDPFRRIHTHE